MASSGRGGGSAKKSAPRNVDSTPKSAGLSHNVVPDRSGTRLVGRVKSVDEAGCQVRPWDAKVLADMVRTDRHNHRPVATDSDTVQAIKVLARAHQSMIWSRVRQANVLRSSPEGLFPNRGTGSADARTPPPTIGRTVAERRLGRR
jgi:hypothetical protein